MKLKEIVFFLALSIYYSECKFGMGGIGSMRKSSSSGYIRTDRSWPRRQEWGQGTNGQDVDISAIDKDRFWRSTTKAPYFENKTPDGKTLSVGAVLDAARTFGLVSLLPLNVPEHKPLLHCDSNRPYFEQIPFTYKGLRYSCDEGTPYGRGIEVSWYNETSQGIEKIGRYFMPFGYINLSPEDKRKFYCSDRTLYSGIPIFCNSTTKIDKSTTIVNCFPGQQPEYQASYIPTSSTEMKDSRLGSWTPKVIPEPPFEISSSGAWISDPAHIKLYSGVPIEKIPFGLEKVYSES